MKITAFLAALAITAPLYSQQHPLDRAAAAVAGKQASFTHQFTPKGFKTTQSESGSVVFGQMPQMRWTYAKPEAKTFVFDGSQSWFYVPADRQVTVGRIDDQRKRELPFLLLGDPAAREKHFVVKQQKRGSDIVTTLTPRSAGLVRAVTVTLDASSYVIERIDYTDRDGNRTAFTFSGYHPAAASAATFRFSPPAGVQVVNAQ